MDTRLVTTVTGREGGQQHWTAPRCIVPAAAWSSPKLDQIAYRPVTLMAGAPVVRRDGWPVSKVVTRLRITHTKYSGSPHRQDDTLTCDISCETFVTVVRRRTPASPPATADIARCRTLCDNSDHALHRLKFAAAK